ncbi:hypothetical protein NOVO_09120 (plasmid) [Rickettsiales bacterium Ac37b]|nr:hypothetical protein NOVO_09120 [Rickettsiales bacterium Ac37b]
MTSSTIEIFARPVKKPLSFTQHLYLVSTDSQGNEKILRSGPECPGFVASFTNDLKVVYADYTKENQKLFDGDFNPSNKVKLYTITGTDIEIQDKMEKMWEIGKQINAGNYDYKLALSVLGCSESICHVQNSNTVANLFAKSIGVDLKPILDQKKLWAPGIDGHLDHTIMDKYTHNYIDGLTRMQNILDGIREAQAQSSNIDLEAIIRQSKVKVEEFRAHKGEYSAAEEYAKFTQLMKDLDLAFVLNDNTSYKYIAYSGTFRPNVYGNSIAEMFNKYKEVEKQYCLENGDNREIIFTIKSMTEDKVFYASDMLPNNQIRGSWHRDGEFSIEKNPDYDPNYLTVLDKQCHSLSEFRDASSPLNAKLDEICTFAGVDNNNLKDEL